jgi:hypothetical protein
MPTLAIYGKLYFNNRQARDRFAADVAREAPARGFIAGPFLPDYPEGGNVPFTSASSGLPALRMCWLHSDQTAIDEAVSLLEASASSNGRQGREDDVFGSGYVHDLDPQTYVQDPTAPNPPPE